MLQVWPSISMFSVGFACSVAIASSSARVASGRSEYRSKSKCTSSNVNSRTGRAVTWILTVSLAVLPSCGHVTVTVTGTVPGCCGAVHGVCRLVRSENVPVGALQLYVTAHPIESIAVAVTVETCPCSTVHGLHCARTVSVCCGAGAGVGGGGGGGGGGGPEMRTPRGDPRRDCQPAGTPPPAPKLLKKLSRLSMCSFQLIPAPANTPFLPCHVKPKVALTGEFRSVTSGGAVPSAATSGVASGPSIVTESLR